MSLASLPLLLALAVLVTASGRLVAVAVGLAPLRRLRPTSAAASSILGTAFVTLAFAWFSSAGFAARDATLGVLLVHALLLALCAWRHALGTLVLPVGASGRWVPLVSASLVGAAVALLPVLRTGGFLSGSDAYTYSAFSDWLQRHAFSEAAVSGARSPVAQIPALYQGQGYALGIAYFLALVQAATDAPTALLVYPAVSGLGLVLSAMAVFVAGRWTLGLSEKGAGVTALAFTILPHPLYWGHHNGFLQQGYALPAVLLVTALLSRVAGRHRASGPAGATFGLLAAFLVTVYVPVLPLVGAATAGAAAFALTRRARRGRAPRRPRGAAMFTGAFALAFAAASYSSAAGLAGRFVRFATSTVGEHIRLGPMEWVQFALAAYVMGPHQVPVEVRWLSPALAALTPLLALAGVLGAVALVGRPRAWPLLAMTGLVIAAAGYFAMVARDPWTGATGHTWSLFKLTQWGFPLVLLAQATTGDLLAVRAPRLARLLVIAGSVLAIGGSSLLHAAWSGPLGSSMQDVFPGPRPLDHLAELKGRVQAQPPGTLVVLARPGIRQRWLASHVALIAYPRPVVGDWTDSASVASTPETRAAYAEAFARIGQPGVVPLLCGFRPFQPGGHSALGHGLAILDADAGPSVLFVVNPEGVEDGPEGGPPRFDMGGGRTKVVLWAPRHASASLELDLAPYPPVLAVRSELEVFLIDDDFTKRAVRTVVEEGSPVRVQLDGSRTIATPPLRLNRGLSTVVLRSVPPQRLRVQGLRAVLASGPAPDRGRDGSR